MVLLGTERNPYDITTVAADILHGGHRYLIINIAKHVRTLGV